MDHSSVQTVYLATGLQSSGSTLLSWCFLQRADMNGTLDGDTDLIPRLPAAVTTRFGWYKTTISCFTLEEQIELLQDQGHEVRPLLLLRDVRSVWLSLQHKAYGRNGITAEDPPLRLRLRRFLASWRYAREHQLPMLRFENFVQQPEAELKKLCVALDLPWDQALLDWPKPVQQIADAGHGNLRFRQSDRNGLRSALDSSVLQPPQGQMHEQDLRWLDQTFAEYNRQMGYPDQVEGISLLPGRSQPSWEVSRRLHWRLRQKPWRYLLRKLGLSRYQPKPQ